MFKMKNIVNGAQNSTVAPVIITEVLPALSAKFVESVSKLESAYGDFSVDSRQQWNDRTAFFFAAFCLFSIAAVMLLLSSQKRTLLHYQNEGEERTRQFNDTYKKFKDSQDQLMQEEKIASMGRLVSGVTHEINMPLSYVSSNLSIVRNCLMSSSH
jgi:C4-dicarboxylate-specific signal transduction histidine kinase